MMRVSTANLYLLGQQGINADQSSLLTIEAELSSGKQINSPADDPVGAGQAALLQSDLTQLAQYGKNQAQAKQLLNSASSALTQMTNIMQSTRTLLVQAGNGTLTDADRSALAAQLQQNLNQLVSLANSGDSQGGYLFGGSANTAPPFVQSGNAVTYAGDDLVQGLPISQARTESVKYPGSALFMNLPTGNGSFTVTPAAGNTGTGALSAGSVTSPSALTGDSYQITIGAGNTYTITDTTTGVSGASTAYTVPATISVGGMQVTLSGAPKPGDSFTLAPAGTTSIFNVVAAAIAALQTSGSSAAAAATRSAALSSSLDGVDQAISALSTSQATVGSQLAELNTAAAVDGDRRLQDQTQLSSIVDLNYAAGASALARQQTQYQAALQSYSDISKLSLFNYL